MMTRNHKIIPALLTTFMLVGPIIPTILWATESEPQKTAVVKLDDPTMPPKFRVKPVLKKTARLSFYDWKVESTLVSPTRRAAVINGHFVEEGDVFEQVKLVLVTPVFLTLEVDKKTYQLPLQSKPVKQSY